MTSEAKRMTVILCCARADVSHLRPLSMHLERKGIPTKLLEGVEDDPHLLGAALDRETSGCLFVACLSDTLGPKDFRRLTGVYNARKGPSHYLADVVVEPDEILVMAETIESALTRATKVIASPDRDKRANSRGPTRLRDVVGVTQLSAVAEAPPSSSRKSKPDGVVERAPLREQSVANAYVISSRKGVRKLEDEGAGEPKRREPPSASESTTASKSSVERVAKPAYAGWMPVVLFLILIAVAGTALLLLLQDQDSANGIIGGRGVPRPAVIQGSDAASNGAAAAAGADQVDADANANAASSDAASSDAASSDAASSDAASGPGEPAEPVDEAAVIREAILSGDLRSIDLILVANPDAKASWRDASNLCRSKSFRGVRGFRLPSLEELETIRNARMLDRDRYWSSTLAPKVGAGNDHAFVLDLEARTLDPVSKDATDVRVLCVRAALP